MIRKAAGEPAASQELCFPAFNPQGFHLLRVPTGKKAVLLSYYNWIMKAYAGFFLSPGRSPSPPAEVQSPRGAHASAEGLSFTQLFQG